MSDNAQPNEIANPLASPLVPGAQPGAQKPAAPANEKQYTQAELEQLFKDAGKRGAIYGLLHFDAYGRDREVIRNALVELVGRMQAEKGVMYCIGEVEEVLERKLESGESEYSTYTEVKILVSSLSRMVTVCLKYAPVSVEIIEPKSLTINAEEIQNILLDAAGISQQFTNFYMTKMLTKEELESFQDHLKQRAAKGKDLMDAATGQTEPKAP